MSVAGDTLSRLFAVEAFDEESGLFAIHPGNLGFAFLCSPLSGYDTTSADKLNVLLNLAFPAGTLMQFVLWSSPDVEGHLVQFQRMRAGTRDPVLRRATRERIEFMRRHTTDPVDRVSGLRIHQAQLVITVKLPTHSGTPTETQLAKAIELRQAVAQTLKTIGMAAFPQRAGGYCRLMSTIVNHGPNASWRESPEPWYDDQQPLAHQILDPTTQVDIDRRALTLGTARVRVLHVRRYPEKLSFGIAMRYLGDITSGNRGIREPLLLTMNLLFPDHESMRAKLETDRVITERNAGKRLARFVPELRMRKESLDALFDALQDGDRVVQGYLGMAVFADDEASSVAAATNARTYFRELGFQLLEDSFVVGPLFANLLPFGAEAEAKRDLMRYRTFASRHFVAFAPVMGAWRGTGTPLATLLSRDGQLMSVSPFDAPTAAHAICCGLTGTGKSFLTQELIANARATGVTVRVIDIGRSYQNLCEILGGQFIEFSAESTICLNPFTHVRDIMDQADALVSLITAMATPSEPLSNVQLAELRRTLGEVFAARRQAMTIDDLAQALRDSSDPRVRDVGTQLYPFTSAGEYGRFFHGRNNLDMGNPFVVLELDELRGRKHLQKVVLMQLMHHIYQEAFLGDRAQQRLAVIDEAWSLLNDDLEVARFIELLWRTGRKVGLAVMAISQDVSSFAQSRPGQAILANSPNMYLLKQRPETIQAAKRDGHLAIGDYGFAVLPTVHSLPGEYSEVMVSCEGAIGVGRLVVSDYQKLLYSTTPAEVAQLRALRREGLSLDDAIHRLLEQRGRGVPAA